jgi:hypothetical protein
MSWGARARGQTTTSIGTLYQNKNAALVVDRYIMKRDILRAHPLLKDRVFTVEDIKNGKLMGTNYFLVWDNEAVVKMANDSYLKGKAEGQKEGLAVGSSMNIAERELVEPKVEPSYDTMKQLMSVLQQIGKMYGVNIFIVPEPKDK